MINIIGNAIGAKTGGGAAANLAFEFTVDTTQSGTSAADQFTIPITSATPYDISTSDGQSITGATGATTITFPAPGTYTVSITDSCEGWKFNNGGDRRKLMTIENWGIFTFTSNGAFHGCSNLVANYTDTPTISTTTLASTFSGCPNFNGYVNDWDVSGVTNLGTMFFGCSSFDQDLGNWDVSSVTNMSYMFNDATIFTGTGFENWNAPLNTSLEFTFRRTDFNADISSWDVSNVTSFYLTFSDTPFNQDISGWTIKSSGNVNMRAMFQGATAFNQSIGSWNTSAVNNMLNMFRGATSFNQPLNGWDTSSVTTMSAMFRAATSFDQPLSNWDTSSVTTMSEMFYNTEFDQDISSWDVSSVSDFQRFMRSRRVPYVNLDMSNWVFRSAGVNCSGMFAYPASAVYNTAPPIGIDSWTTTGMTNIGDMFVNCQFTGILDVSGWDVSSVTTMSYAFWQLNKPLALVSLSNWDTSNVSNMIDAFRYFNKSGGSYGFEDWDISSLSNAGSFLSSATPMSRAEYDALLVNWEAQAPSNAVSINFGTCQYTLGSAAETARTSLINTYGWTITDGGGVLTNESYLVASYNFDADFSDYTGNHLLTPSGSTPPVAGVAGGVVSNCAEFNSTGDYTLTADSDDFSFTDGVSDLPFSVSFWANFTSYNSTSTGGAWFLSKRGGGTNEEYQIQVYQNEFNLALFSGGGNSNVIRATISYPPPIGSWHHYAVTYDGSATFAGIKIYIDGVSQTLTDNSFGTYVGMTNGTQDVNIGSRSWQPSLGSFWGKLDEMHIWKNRELTSAVVLDIYNTEDVGNSIFPIDYTTDLVASYNFDADFSDYTGVNNGTAVGTPLTAQAGGVVSNCLLNNTTSYVSGGNDISLQATTVSFSAWVKTDPAGQGGSVKGILTKARAWGLYMLANGNVATYQWPSVGFIDTGVNIDDNTWHHVCMTMQDGVSNGTKIYIDGALVSTFTYNISQQTIDLRIGGGENTNQYLNGQIDEAHVWANRLLDATEVSDMYNTEDAGNSIL